MATSQEYATERGDVGNRPFGGVTERLARSPLRITLAYLGLGIVALFFSDLFLPRVFSGSRLVGAQALKGAIEVLLTAGLIYALTAAGHASLRRTAADAERNRTELQLLHRVLRHNLRNNLTLVLGNARRLREDLEGPSQRAHCNEVITAAEEIERWSHQADEIRRITAEAEPVEIDLAERIPAAVDASEHVDADDVRLAIPDHAPVRVSPQFELAIEELLSNAVEHGTTSPRSQAREDAGEHGGDEAIVTVGVNCQGGTTSIEIDDRGPGFPEHVLAAVNRLGEDQLVHLDGLGLWLAYLIVIDGELLLENRADGATARITVPAA